MAKLLTSPRGMELQDWAAALALDLSQDSIPAYRAGMDWTEWAALCMDGPTLSRSGAPWPFGFSDWREWAERVFQTAS